MPLRLAATTSFVVFTVCLLAGADNTFGTAVGRALEAMGATLALGLIVGWMAQKMIDENVTPKPKSVPDPGENASETGLAANKKSDNKGAKSAVKKDAGKPAKRGR